MRRPGERQSALGQRGPGRGPAIGRWLAAWMLALGIVALIGPAEASDRVLVPSASELWRTRLKEALSSIQRGRMAPGLEILEAAITDRSGDLYEVRNEDLLETPLDVEIEDEVLVTEKSELTPVLPRVRVRNLPRPRVGLRRPADDSVGNRPRRFVPVSTVAQILLRKLPPPVLEEYRARNDARALSLLEEYRRTGDLAFLTRLVEDYFFSSYGDRAAEGLADAHWEAGEVLEAIRLWRMILLRREDPPEPTDSRLRVTAKLARALRSLARESEAELVLRSLQGAGEAAGSSPTAKAAGRAPLESLVLSAGPLPRQDRYGSGSPLDWAPSRWGGELIMDALPELSGRSFELSWDSWTWMPEPVNLVGHPFTLLVDETSLFVSGPYKVHRLDARPGRGSLLEEYAKPGLRLSYPDDNETLHYALTLWKKRLEPYPLLADLPDEIIVTSFIADLVDFDHYLGYEINAEVPIRGLIAFDGATSLPLWKVSEEALEDPLDVLNRRARARLRVPGRKLKESGRSAGEKGLSYNSPVLVKQGLVVAGGWVQRGYINSVIRAHDLRDGSLVWETLVSSAQLEQTMFGELAREPFPGAICEEGGVVYYCTQQGAVAAVELETGRLSWLMTYETIPIETTYGRHARKRLLSWGPNSMLIKDNILIVTPRDSRYLYAIDTGRGPGGMAEAGTVLWKYHDRRGELRDFLGCHEGYLYFSGHGTTAVLRLDIRDLDAWGRLAGPGRAGVDREGLGTLAQGEGPDVAGRSPRLERAGLQLGIGPVPPGALTTHGVVIAAGGRLKLVSFDLQEISDLSPPFRDIEGRSVPGRVQVSGGMVFMTSTNLISAYSPKKVDQ